MSGAASIAGAVAGGSLGATIMGSKYMKNTAGRVPEAIQGFKNRQKKIFNMKE